MQKQAAEVTPGACARAATGEPERAVHSLTGEAGGRASFPGAVEEGRGIAAGREAVEPEAADDAGGVAVEVPGGSVTSCPSRDPQRHWGC